MSVAKNNIKNKKPRSRMFPDAVINNDLKKYADSPAVLKKVEEAKKFLANFKFS